VDEDGIEGIIRQCELIDIAVAHAAMAQPCTVEPRPRECQHVKRQIKAEAALNLRAEQFEHASGAGPEVEERAHGRARERRNNRFLDRFVRHLKIADPVPLGGVATEIALRSGGASGAYRGQPLTIACKRRVREIEPRNKLAREVGGPTALTEPEEGPGAFPEAIDQPRFHHEAQMTRNARLRLAKNGGEIGDGELRLTEQHKNAQPGRLAGGFERGIEALKRQLGRYRHFGGNPSRPGTRVLAGYIKVSLYVQAANSRHAAHERASMNDEKAFDVRDGEMTAALPETYDASLYFIGRIRTPWTERENCPKNARESDAVCTLEFDPRWVAALKGVESCTHIIVLYWMERSRRDLVIQVPRHYGVGRGTFALRSPARPNPIALSVVRLVGVSGTRVSVVGLDCLDQTPLLDIKPYFASTDAVAEAVVGWHAERHG
jgi:tRNA-Thr(GGU) m(6)t(6)A37 methyltransferase TsaA